MGYAFLEDFGSAAPTNKNSVSNPGAGKEDTAIVDAEKLEQARLEGFEAGYKAGWDDAAKAETEEQSRIGAAFARNLQDLGFTFQEARAHVMQALEPLLEGMVERVLPKLVTETIGQTIVEEMLSLAASAADAPIEIVASPQNRPAIEAFLEETRSIPFSIVEEPTLAEGQVFLRSGQFERHIDFSSAVEQIGAAINGLYELNERAFQHG